MDPTSYSTHTPTIISMRHFSATKNPPVSYEGQYSPDVVAAKAFGFLDEAVQSDRPFFLTIAPISPHSDAKFPKDISSPYVNSVILGPPIPAERHQNLFENVTVPRTANFNPEKV